MCVNEMPPKSKRKKKMEVLRQAKKRKEESMSSVDSGDPQSSAAETIPTFSDYDSEEDSTFDPEEEDFDEEVSIHTYSQEWVESLDRDYLLSLSILLWYLLVNVLQFQLTEAAKLIGNVIVKSDRTVREWRATFIANEGEFPDTMQGNISEREFCGTMKNSIKLLPDILGRTRV